MSIFIFSSYIRSDKNKEADGESRICFVDAEWKLGMKYFRQIEKYWKEPDIDLFAYLNNDKSEKYVSSQGDPNAIAIDAFIVSRKFFLAFPPFSMILPAIQKIIFEKAEGILVVFHWPTQVWFPLFKKLLIGGMLIFDPTHDLLFSPFWESHPLSASLTLVAHG